MNQNIVFYFSGTGNSLKAAKDIAGALDNCKLVSMGKPYTQSGEYDRVGFVFPVYAMGIPPVVSKFIKRLDVSKIKNAYFFAVATCGNSAGNSLAEVNRLLRNKDIELNYGKKIVSFANCVGLYGMAKDPEQKAAAADTALLPIIHEIVSKAKCAPPKPNPILSLIHNLFVSGFQTKDKGFKVSDKCVSCGTCAKVCPVSNIKINNGKPEYKHSCQQCMACIQWCPNSAINYKKKTQNRGRYHHPAITIENMAGHIKVNESQKRGR